MRSYIFILGGALWGTATVVAATAIVIGEGGMFLPWFLAVGPLILVSERLPVAVTGLVLTPLLYAFTTLALWRTTESRLNALFATLLYATFLAGPLLGMTGHLWSDTTTFDYQKELSSTVKCSRSMLVPFTVMLIGLLGWHAFAWWRLSKFWCADDRPAFVRCVATGLAAMVFGGWLAHFAQALFVASHTLPQLLTQGPVLLLEFVLPRPGTHWYWVVSGAATYAFLGATIAAARNSRIVFWLALSGLLVLTVGTLVILGYLFAANWQPAFFLQKISQGVDQHPILYLTHTSGVIAWQVWVVTNLWRAFDRRRDRLHSSFDP